MRTRAVALAGGRGRTSAWLGLAWEGIYMFRRIPFPNNEGDAGHVPALGVGNRVRATFYAFG